MLTGFKFIGEQIGMLEVKGKAGSYIFGFEESYGYLSGTHVRNKDAIAGSIMICEMFAYYRTQGISLLDKLNELYETYGFCLNTLHSYNCSVVVRPSGTEPKLKDYISVSTEIKEAAEEIKK